MVAVSTQAESITINFHFRESDVVFPIAVLTSEKLSALLVTVASYLMTHFPARFPLLIAGAIQLGIEHRRFRPEDLSKTLAQLELADHALVFISFSQLVDDRTGDNREHDFTQHNITLDNAQQGVEVQHTRLDHAGQYNFQHDIDEHSGRVHMDARQDGDASNRTRFEFFLEHKNYTELRLRLHGDEYDEYRIQFQKIIQFIPSDPTVGFQATDTITNTVSMNVGDGAVQYAVPTCANNTDGLLTCIVVASDPETQAVIFQFQFQMAPRQFTHNAATIPPNRGKFSLVINEPQTAANEMTAIVVRIRIRKELAATRRGTTINFGGSASLDWDATFTDDHNTAQPVLASTTLLADIQGLDDNAQVPVDRTDYRVVFTFAKLGCTSILWDPSIGVPRDSDSNSSALSTGAIVGIAVGSAVALALIALIAIVIVKKNTNTNSATGGRTPTPEDAAPFPTKFFPTLDSRNGMLASVNFAAGASVSAAPPPYSLNQDSDVYLFNVPNVYAAIWEKPLNAAGNSMPDPYGKN